MIPLVFYFELFPILINLALALSFLILRLFILALIFLSLPYLFKATLIFNSLFFLSPSFLFPPILFSASFLYLSSSSGSRLIESMKSFNIFLSLKSKTIFLYSNKSTNSFGFSTLGYFPRIARTL